MLFVLLTLLKVSAPLVLGLGFILELSGELKHVDA
jgi:hypothetical protein